LWQIRPLQMLRAKQLAQRNACVKQLAQRNACVLEHAGSTFKEDIVSVLDGLVVPIPIVR
jgi:hypothetical protein